MSAEIDKSASTKLLSDRTQTGSFTVMEGCGSGGRQFVMSTKHKIHNDKEQHTSAQPGGRNEARPALAELVQ